MEIDQSLLESLPQEQRQKVARRMRQEQIRRYHEREKSLASQPKRKQTKKAKRVGFRPRERLRDAVQRSDHDEGEKLRFCRCSLRHTFRIYMRFIYGIPVLATRVLFT